MRIVALFFAFILASGVALAEDYCEGCGCKGGPGYRASNGRCVGWKQLNKVCGTPPTARCTAEGPALLATQKLGIAGVGDAEAARPPVTSNQILTLGDGVGCLTTGHLENLRNCTKGEASCEGERQVLLDDRSCILMPPGTPVTVEASSRSFEWLRVRIPGVVAPMWAERGIILGSQ